MRLHYCYIRIFRRIRKGKPQLSLHSVRAVGFQTDCGLFAFLIIGYIFLFRSTVYAVPLLYPVQRQQIAVDQNIGRINAGICKGIFRHLFVL